MKIFEAVKSKKRCYRQAKPTKVYDFGNPAVEHTFDAWDLAADDWEPEGDEVARLRLEVGALKRELEEERAKGKARADVPLPQG